MGLEVDAADFLYNKTKSFNAVGFGDITFYHKILVHYVALCSIKKLAQNTELYLQAADGTSAINQRQWQNLNATSCKLVDMTIVKSNL